MEIIRNPKPISASAPENHCVIAIGDVHAQMDLFEQILASAAKIVPKEAERVDLVLLGDVIDRGPKSKTMLDWLAEGHPDWPTTALLGNHEQFLLHILEAPKGSYRQAYNLWMSNGGKDTLKSFAEKIPDPRTVGSKEHKEWLKKTLSKRRLDVLNGLKSHIRFGDLLFVHAGIDPGLSLKKNFSKSRLSRSDTHWAWIRGPFLNHEGPYPDNVFVVHGHTILPGPRLHPHRIGLDTGGYRYGVLTGAVFFNNTITIFQATRN